MRRHKIYRRKRHVGMGKRRRVGRPRGTGKRRVHRRMRGRGLLDSIKNIGSKIYSGYKWLKEHKPVSRLSNAFPALRSAPYGIGSLISGAESLGFGRRTNRRRYGGVIL